VCGLNRRRNSDGVYDFYLDGFVSKYLTRNEDLIEIVDEEEKVE
jgi:hypothetical protein